ncbi:MAG: hypothetical protein HYY17_13520 [Planctomycetes bacterium]|nr:hypothetical protein [Planctomycetota bacterium]
MAEREKPARSRPFVCVLFECCRIYQRIYLNRAGTAFQGWCPRCCAKLEIKVDPQGSPDRFFSAR